jgi:hypothetical protein
MKERIQQIKKIVSDRYQIIDDKWFKKFNKTTRGRHAN